ncbi:histone-fold-containing protein [Xylariaceae sp. FL1019]|nr:histone-fold-containing protein [Xylariaceae sp. FL1019]
MSDSPQSPPKDVDHGVQSPDDEAQMNDPQDPHAAGLAYEFEVKEQDRWLPIANVSNLGPACAFDSKSRPVSGIASCGASGRPRQLVLAVSSMSYDSPADSLDAVAESLRDPKSPKGHKHDVYDANIRNFAPVARIMKLALPENAKIAKEAKECMQECVSEFISFITSEASEKCHQEKRKTVNGEDILFAMTSLGFENYAEALKIYLAKYRESQSNRGDNQQRPGSQGYGAGPSGSGVGTSGFQPGDGTGIGETGESYMYAPGGHNGSTGDGPTY